MAYYRSNYPSDYAPSSGPPPPPMMGGGGYGQTYSAYNVNYPSYQSSYPSTGFPPYGGYGGNHDPYQALQTTCQTYQSLSYAPQYVPPPPQPPPTVLENDYNRQMYENQWYAQQQMKQQIQAEKMKEQEESQQQQQQQEQKQDDVAVVTPTDAGAEENMKAQLKEVFVNELMRRLSVSGTFDMTEGTVHYYPVYSADDPVVLYNQKEENDDLTGKKWDAEKDCIYLRWAMKGLGTNEAAITHVVATRNNQQRQQMKKQFKTMYGRDLIKDIESELSGDYRSAIMALFVPPAELDAYYIKEAIYGPGTDEESLIEILMTRTNPQIQELRNVYEDVASPNRKKCKNLIEKDITDDTSGDFKRLLISACQGNRGEISREQLMEAVEEITVEGKGTGMYQVNYDKLANMELAKREAQKLFKAGEDRWGTDEEMFNRIFSLRDYYQLRATWNEYVKICQRDIINSIDRETSGDFKRGLKAIVGNIKCRPKYFAHRLRKSMKGLGTDDKTLIRIVVTRSEIDMVQIKKEFLDENKQTLYKYIQDDTSGDYRKLLLALVKKD